LRKVIVRNPRLPGIIFNQLIAYAINELKEANMPNFDETGPHGEGPLTGCGRGNCDTSEVNRKSAEDECGNMKRRRMRQRCSNGTGNGEGRGRNGNGRRKSLRNCEHKGPKQ